MSLHIQTPLLQSSSISAHAGRSIWLKMETMQPSGSFKLRGIGHACEVYAGRGAKRFISSSGGNAGLAVAYSGRKLNIPVTVVVPETTSQKAIDLLKLEQANVKVHGVTWQEANELALSLIGDEEAFLHPFDNPLLWQGHSTMIDEVYDFGLKPDAIVLSVGGGGMLSGVAEGIKKNGWEDIPIFAVETRGAASFHEAINAGNPVQLEIITSVASTLGAKKVCQNAYDLTNELSIQSILVSDQDALNSCRRFLDDHRVVVEPACGASLSIVYQHAEKLKKYENVLIIVCGGVTATVNQINEWANALSN